MPSTLTVTNVLKQRKITIFFAAFLTQNLNLNKTEQKQVF